MKTWTLPPGDRRDDPTLIHLSKSGTVRAYLVTATALTEWADAFPDA